MAPKDATLTGASSLSKTKPRSRSCSTTTLVLLLVVASNLLMVFLLYNSAPATEHETGPQPNVTKAGASSQNRPLPVPHVPQRRCTYHLSASCPFLLTRSAKRFDPGHGLQGFIHFSAYRVGEGDFVATGLSALQLQSTKQATRCSWTLPNGTFIGGNIRLLYPGEHHACLYETILLRCHLSSPATASAGGVLRLTIDKEEVAVYSEPQGTPEWTPPGPSFAVHLTYCSPPLYGTLDPKQLQEWLHFHQHVHEVEHFHMYDAGGLDDPVHSVLRPYTSMGQMDVTDITPTLRYDTWLYSQVLVVNDCALRSRSSSRWTLMMDLDEYLHIMAPPHRLLPFLEPLQDLPWVSIGSLTYSVDTCSKVAEEAEAAAWAVERLVFHETTAYCRDPTYYPSRELCLKWDGHRKYCINPRRVEALQIHRVMDAEKGGLNLHTSLVRMNHYRGLGVRDIKMCRRDLYNTIPPPKGFVRDRRLAELATSIRLT